MTSWGITPSGLWVAELTLPQPDGSAVVLRAVVGQIPIGIDDHKAWVGELRDLDDRPAAVQAGRGEPSVPIVLVAFGDEGAAGRLLASLEQIARQAYHVRRLR